MHVTARLAKEEEDVEVGEDCRCLQALKEAIVVALPQLRVEWFDVSVGGRTLDDDDSVVALQEGVCLDVVPNTRGLSALALREAGREVSEGGLLAAAGEGDVALCTQFLDAGVPIDCADADGRTPLHYSCLPGHVEVARLLLDRGSRAIDKKESSGGTPLLISCLSGQLETVRLLLDRGSAIDEKAAGDTTPLHVSCLNGHLEVATLLLDRGSRAIDAKDDGRWTPLHVSCISGRLEIATLLLDRGSRAIDAKDDHGSTPLHFSCINGHVETTRLLLKRGSRAIAERTCDGHTPLSLSYLNGHFEVVGLLRNAVSNTAPNAKRRRSGEQCVAP